MNIVRKFIKNLVFIFFYFLKFIFNREQEVVALMYHSVENTKRKLGVNVKDFERQLKFLKNNYDIIDINDTLNYIKGIKKIKNKSVVITLDDAYLDTYTNVFPLLKKYDIKITVFLTTNLEKINKLDNFLRPSWEQIKEMYDSGLVRFEVHGHNHLNLIDAYDNLKILENEVLKCQKMIEQKLGYKSQLIAYASGRKNEKVISFLKNNNFKAGFTINEGLIRPNADLFKIKRVQVDRTMNWLLFKIRLTKAIDYNRKVIDVIRKIYVK